MADKQKKFIPFYLELEAKTKGSAPTLRVFERTAKARGAVDYYYTTHGENALFVADEFYKTRDVVKTLGTDQKLAGVTIAEKKLITILKELLVSGKKKDWRVEVWTQDDKTKEWGATKKASPGNLSALEDMLGIEASAQSSAVVAIKLARGSTRKIGVAFCDTTLKTLQVCEFEDNERFSNLESVLVQRGAKECLLGVDKASTTPGDMRKINNILQACGVPVTEEKSADFRNKDVEQNVGRLVGGLEQHLAELEKTDAMGAVCCLIKHLELLRDETAFGRYKLNTLDLSEYMALDNAAMDALNLFPAANDSDKNMNLYGLLNKGKTAIGARLLTTWIKQPLLKKEHIERRLDLVEIFADDTTLRSELQDTHLRRVPDLERMAKKFQKSKGNLQLVVDLYKFVVGLPGMIASMQEHTGAHEERLKNEFANPLQGMLDDLSQFEAMVEQTVDLEAIENHEYLINPEFDPRLAENKAQKERVKAEMQELLGDVADDLDLDLSKVKLNWAANYGDHFRVSRKDEKKLRKKKNYISLDTRKDGVRFTYGPMKKLSREHTELRKEYEAMQAEIVDKCLEIVTSYTPVLEKLTRVLSELDVLVGFAHVSVNGPMPYCRPTIAPMGSKTLQLEGCRHPCMEVQDRVSFISNDLLLEKGKSNVQVITGPNMGGKSTYIRQTGVVTLMAQVGCFVPCDSATLPIVDCILARVGAGDSQLKGVSTFMKEMLEASSILKGASQNSLIIIDELGRGTSTYDGFGLAWAISEHIAEQIGAFCLFATHFHELTALAKTAPSVVNKHVTAHTDENSITMLYKVNDGPCDRSFGIHVSELANFPAAVIASAKRKAAELENFGNAVCMEHMQELEKQKAEQNNADTEASDGNKKRRIANGNGTASAVQAEVEAFLKEFQQVPLSSMSEQDARKQLVKLQAKLEGNESLKKSVALMAMPMVK